MSKNMIALLKPWKKIWSNKIPVLVIALVALCGFLDATFLTIKHVRGELPTCSIVHGCDQVLTSPYSAIGPVPVALLGALFYLLVLVLALVYLDLKKESLLPWIARLTIVGLAASLYFLVLQIFVLKAYCLYCLVSIITSTLLFALGRLLKK